MRTTKQREAVKEAVHRLGCHPSADEVYEEVRKTMPGISLGTVYRNLRLLSGAGDLVALDGAGTACRYDACVDDHYHFRCERCGKLVDVTVSIDPDLNLRVEEATGLSVRCHVVEFRGLCNACQRLSDKRGGSKTDEAMAGTGRS